MIAALLLSLVAAAAPWQHAETDARIDFSADWTPTESTELVPGQLVQLLHTPTGGGAIVRAQPVVELLAMPPAVLEKVGDVEAAMAADRYAEVVMLSQEDKVLEEATLYLGLSDVAGARVGRWVFTTPATDTEPARTWWHATWRTSTHFMELVSWVPSDRLPLFATAMRSVERNLGSASGWAPGSAMLFRDNRPKCEGPAAADRMKAISDSGAYRAGRDRIESEITDLSAKSLAELTLLGELVAKADDCVKPAGLSSDACTIYERVSDTERSKRVQAAIVACIDQS